MTDIDAMPAGKEMDELVASQVMGWAPHIVGGSLAVGWDAPNSWRRIEFTPSTNIAHAWEVVANLGMSVVCGPGAGQWMAGILEDACYMSERGTVDGRMTTSAIADTAPLAICRAALKASAP